MAVNTDTWTRRTRFGLGAAMLVSGWGTTRCTGEQQQAEPMDVLNLYGRWVSGYSGIPPKFIYMSGVVSMALGACLIGSAALRTDKESR